MLFEGPIPGPQEQTETAMLQQNELTASGHLNPARPQTILHLASGETLILPTELLLSAAGQSATAQLASANRNATANPALSASTNGTPGERVIPLFEEKAEITKKLIETAKVRIQRSTETFNQTVSLPLTSTTWDIEHIPIGQLLTNRPEVRQEGEVTIYPLVEERFVAKREYFLIEEVHVRRTAKTTEQTATLELHRDVLSVEREALTNEG